MKKLLIIAVLALFTVNAYAENPYEKALGLRLGSSVGVTYKQFVSSQNAFEIIGEFGFTKPSYFTATGIYMWEWNLTDGLYWFVGPGASVGVIEDHFNLAIDGMIGLEYKFDIPLALGIDLNPRWYFLESQGFGWSAALSVRYCF